MKKTAALFFLISILVFPQGNFEGKISMSIEAGGESTELDYLVKGEKIRIDVSESQDAAMIMDSKNLDMTILIPEQKMYMVFPLKNMTGNKMEESRKTENEPEFEKTGEKKDIHGYTCEKWLIKNEENTVEAWVTEELGTFMFAQNPMGDDSNVPEWQKQFEGKGFFPMLLIEKNSSGDVESKMEVTNVEKTNLSNDLFTVPSGYTKMDMPGMGN